MHSFSSAFVAVCARSSWVPSTRSSRAAPTCPTRRLPQVRIPCTSSAALSFDDEAGRVAGGELGDLGGFGDFQSVASTRAAAPSDYPFDGDELTALGLDVGGTELDAGSSKTTELAGGAGGGSGVVGQEDDMDDVDIGEDDEDEDDDEDGTEKDDDEDEDLASYEIETDDEDELVAVSGRRTFDDDGLPIVGSPAAGGIKGDLGIGGVDADEDDDVVDFDEAPGEVLDVGEGSGAGVDEDDDVEAVLGMAVGADEDEAAEEELLSIDSTATEDQADEDELLDEESEAELRSAAANLKGSSLLGLGIAGGTRADSSQVASFALGDAVEGNGGEEIPANNMVVPGSTTAETSSPKNKSVSTPASRLGEFSDLVKRAEETTVREEVGDDDMSDPGEVEEDFDDPALEDDSLQGPKNLDAYTDDDEHDDELADFGVTTSTNFGRVWELNDDAYVTISEAGEAYAYDIDEADSDDQDSAVMRRGAAAGWGGSLQSDARSALPVGSKEWIARRAYDLVADATPSEMFKWTRARKGPPRKITRLFPPEPPAPAQFAATLLDTCVPSPDGDDSSTWVDDENAGRPPVEDEVKVEVDYEPVEGQEAIERAVDFPCMYKFKVVGSGPDFVTSLTSDMEAVLGRKVSSSAFEFEPAGRYQRIIISVQVENARQVTELYEAVRMADGVKFSYG